MCLIAFAYKIHPSYPLVLVANRDEFHNRPTREMHWWKEFPQLLAGKDLKAGGTWLGMTSQGRIAAITNVREQIETTGRMSRGTLPLQFLTETTTINQFNTRLVAQRASYPGYNLLYGTLEQLYFYSNRGASPLCLPPGIHGLSNASLNTPWPKVAKLKKLLATQLRSDSLQPEQLINILDSTEPVPDAQLPHTGVSLAWERRLAAIRIISECYSTLSSYAILINNQGEVTLTEKQRAPQQGPLQSFKFVL